MGRLINHSRGALYLEVVAIVQDGKKRLALIADKTIKALPVVYSWSFTKMDPKEEEVLLKPLTSWVGFNRPEVFPNIPFQPQYSSSRMVS